MKRTQALVKVATALLADEGPRHWGYDLSKRSGVRSGVMYPILKRMLDADWLADGWEQSANGKPPRRYYEITPAGRVVLEAMTGAAS